MNVSFILQKWYAHHKRNLPWRKTSTPYYIWLSEIILQQTRVIQGQAYYLKFIREYPRIENLAAASLDEVLKLWQGLGYYTRARHLHATARYICTELNGIFPGTYRELLKLKGIGKYSAAAIASIAFREPVAVVDGNVYRVISRIFGIDLSIDSVQGKEEFSYLASQILDIENPHLHNQAIMEFGALVCRPKNPECTQCPLTPVCVALKTGRTSQLPVKATKKSQRDRYFNYLYIVNQGFTWLNKRNTKDIWHSLYEFPMIETADRTDLENLSAMEDWREILGTAKAEPVGAERHYLHQLTHQTIHGSFYQIITAEEPLFAGKQPLKIRTGDLPRYAVPRLIEKYLTDLNQEKRL